MPYTSVSQVPSRVPKAKRKQWMDIWNSVYKKAKDDGKSDSEAESLAFAEANGVIKKESHSMKRKAEFRSFRVELRASKKEGDQPAELKGHAAVFNTLSHDLGGFRERIAPGAFSRSLKEKQDVRALINHDPDKVLGRSKAGTLELSEDNEGLQYRVVLPETTYARDLAESVSRRDIDENSFGFIAREVKWLLEPDPEDDSKKIAVRELRDVDLMDVSVVTYPAYPETDVAMRAELRSRALAEAPKEIRDRILAEQRDAGDSFEDTIFALAKAISNKWRDNYGSSKYWLLETYADSAIVKCWGDDKFYRITWHEDADGNVQIDDTMVEVEQEWVPSERARQILAEQRDRRKVIVIAGGHSDDEVRQALLRAGVELRAEEKKTKKVDGVDLASDCFAYVGDSQDTSTWKLPIKFPGDEEKTKRHIRNALARFNQTKGIPAGEKAKVLAKIKAAAKKYDIKVSEENSRRWGYAGEELRDMMGEMAEEMSDGEGLCHCDCPECQDGNCEDCSDPDCDDPDCIDGDGDIRSQKPVTAEERERLLAQCKAKAAEA